MALGFHYPVLGGGLLNGMWLAFIGWFLSNAANASYQQLLIRQALQEVPVSRVMRAALPPIVPATAPIAELVDQWVLRSDDMLYPVGDADRVIGFVHVADIRRIPRNEWRERTVGELMSKTARLATAHPDDNAFAALQRLGREDADAIAVVDGGRLVGLLRRQDVLRWVSLQAEEDSGWRPTRRGTASA
jgi:CBS domain-containing protein